MASASSRFRFGPSIALRRAPAICAELAFVHLEIAMVHITRLAERAR